MSTLNAQDFGFLPANSGTDNKAGWEAAITAAQTQGEPLYVPAGTYALKLAPDGSEGSDGVKGVILTRSVTVFGDGPDHTVIDVYPKIVSFPYHVIWWDTPDLHVTVRDLKVLGPTGTSETHPNEMPPCSLMMGNTVPPYGSDNRVTVDGLVVTGKFASVIYTENGDGLVDVRNSDLTGLSECVAVFESTGMFLNKRFHADNCRFASGVPAAETSDGQPFGACVYLHPHVAARVTNCRFHDNPRVAIKQYGVQAVGNPPKYSLYQGCHFYNCTGFTIITPGEHVVTLIEECYFDRGYVACRNTTDVIGCEFRNSAGITTTAGHHEEQFEVNVVECRVHQSDSGTTFTDAEGMALLVRDCAFIFAEGPGGATGVSLGTADYGAVYRCRFVSLTTPVSPPSAGVFVGPQAGSWHKVERCSFAGNYSIAAISLQPGAEFASAEVNGCDFSGVIGAPIHFNSGSTSFGNVIQGRANVFNDGAMTDGGAGADMTARLRLRRATAVGIVYAVEVPPETPADPGPPKHQIVLDRSYNTFRVRGDSIDYVYVGSKREANKFEGPVHLIAGNEWSLSNGGNIRPRKLGRRRYNGVVTLFLDPVSGLWYE